MQLEVEHSAKRGTVNGDSFDEVQPAICHNATAE
jgi:hypothetical protein